MIKRRTKNDYDENGVTELFKINLGGHEQWVMIRSVNKNNPLLLFLHGGPGTSNIGIAADTQRQLEENFVVVNWDQLGAGLSYSKGIPEEALTINKMIEYTVELIHYLLQRFHKSKVILMGHSWGTVIGILISQKYPEIIEKYIGISQMVNGELNEKIAYEYCLGCAVKTNNARALKQLNSIGNPPYSDWTKGLQIRSRWSNTFRGAVKDGNLSSIYIKKMLKSSEYKLSDIYKFMAGFTLSLNKLWPEIMEVKLDEDIRGLKVPVYFFLGRNDYQAPSVIAEEFAKSLVAKTMEIVWFEESAHMCNMEEEDRFTFQILRICKEI